MAKGEAALGRLAMRVEGDFWVAYWAKLGTMNGAVVLGTLRMNLAEDPGMKAAFMALMQAAFAAIVKQTLKADVVWPDPPEVAPEHERAGRA